MKEKIDVIAESSFIHDYAHHSYQNEAYLVQFLTSPDEEYPITLSLDTYVNVMAPTPLRARKNSLISFLTIYCRIAIDLGLPAEKSFSVSDYFINEIEKAASKADLELILDDILYGYKYLVATSSHTTYSLHVARGISFIQEHIHERLSLSDVAVYLGLQVPYVCALFSKEVGLSPKQYILQQKIKVSKSLLLKEDLPISELAEVLGFTDSSHFYRTFKKITGVTPREFCRRNRLQ